MSILNIDDNFLPQLGSTVVVVNHIFL